ncbi:hypothetical protein HanHA300_Chr02g0043711 [Helianthus annuus]|nr:hypothetical protein HanHA300_Chr02g0043711 [Helianthus annuus]KAJ0617918.1 hypothetical protein HanHA89_Chr02g0047181 [Helianthus annuus]
MFSCSYPSGTFLCRRPPCCIYPSMEDNPFHGRRYPRDRSGFHGSCSPSLRSMFMTFALDPEIFNDQYNLSICEGFFRGAGMLQRVNASRDENEGLMSELKTSQTVAAELRCRVVDAEKKLLERENDGVMLEQMEKTWERD